MKKAVVLVIDGLSASALGPYGNTTFLTPGFNQLASRSFLAEHVLIDSPSINASYNAMLSGGHGLYSSEFFSQRSSLPGLLRQSSKESVFVSDDIQSIELADDFDRQIVLDCPAPTKLAETPESSWAANFFTEALAAFEEHSDASLFWLHCSGLSTAWDAPYEFREQFVDEDDPDPPRDFLPPAFWAVEPIDLDLKLGYSFAYGGQVMLLDMMVEAFVAAVESHNDAPLFVITSSRGYPLGEHGVFGFEDAPLESELTQVPLLFLDPSNELRGVRSQAILQFGDIFHLLTRWFECGEHASDATMLELADSMDEVFRTHAFCANSSEAVLRTPFWYVKQSLSDDDPAEVKNRIYLRPDDKWNLHDVSELCSDIVGELTEYMPRARSAIKKSDLKSAIPPPSLLTPRD